MFDFKMAVTFLCAPFHLMLTGWAFSLLWAWFFVPIFEAPALSIGQSIGVSMVAKFLVFRHEHKEEVSDEAFLNNLMALFVRPFVFLFAAFIVKQFI